jgi:hypothetical protein
LDNPFVSNTPTKWYVNQDWANNARTYGGASIAGLQHRRMDGPYRCY